MALTPGTKLGPYEIRSALGAGGMGEVYSALDARLDRQVAVKILAAHLSASPELKQRFEREARAISALNHSSICQLYDIGSQDGVDFLVMEFLEGETLADRLRKGVPPLNETLKIGIAISGALAFAHRHGIVHRDLKPGNIMLTKAGAKLMDFGLAKPLGLPAGGLASGAAPSFTAAPTVSGPSPLSPLTAVGSVVGTIQYMSPEQIEGREADARSDIFALGAVLYEMATGNRPFQGKSQISLASSILEKDPDPVSAVVPGLPPAFDHVVSVCLQKNPDERFQTANDIQIELQWIASGKSSPAAVAAPAAQPTSFRRERLGWIAALLAVTLLAGAAATLFFHPSKPAPVIHAFLNPPENAAMNLVGDAAGPPVLSPDGSMLAFAATTPGGATQLWVRRMDSGEAHSLSGTDGASFPFWSPDNRSLGFFAQGKLKTIELNGGAAQVLGDAALGRGGAWAPGGVIVYTPDATGPMQRVDITARSTVPFSTLDTAQHTSHRWPSLLPDGKHILYLAMHHEPSKAANNAIYYASLDGRENRLVMHSQSSAIYAAGYILVAREDQLLAQPFDPGKGTVSGEPRVVAKGIMNDYTTWHMDASACADGTLVYAVGGSGDTQLIWLDRAGKEIGIAADKLANLAFAALSPQGDRAALQIDAGVTDIWVLDLARGLRTRLTFGPVSNITPVWSPDGKWIAYSSIHDGRYTVLRKRSDGSGAEETLATVDQNQPLLSDWSRDGKYIFYFYAIGDSAGAWVLPLEGERKPRRVLDRGAVPVLSPDGRWLAYTSAESGTPEIFVVGFEGAQGKWQVSSHGGSFPRWTADGKDLFYLDSSFNLLSVPVTSSGGALQFDSTQTRVINWSAPNLFFDITPDGKRIISNKMLQHVSQSVTLVTNFTAELNKKP